MRMASNERSMEEFQAVHNMILEVLRNEKVPAQQWPSVLHAKLVQPAQPSMKPQSSLMSPAPLSTRMHAPHWPPVQRVKPQGHLAKQCRWTPYQTAAS